MSSKKLLAALTQRKQQVQQAQQPQVSVAASSTPAQKSPAAASAAGPKKAQQQPQQATTPKSAGKKRKSITPSPAASGSSITDAASALARADAAVAEKKQKLAHAAASKTKAAPASASSRPLSALQQKMASKLAGARFRWLNEKLYTCSGAEAYEYFQEHPEEFDEYHKGFGVQVLEWPVSPLDQFITYLKERPNLVAGDFGCGEARLAASVPNKVHSFDLVAHNDRVTACNMSHVPLDDAQLDVAVFCLSLMGVDFMGFIREAHRTLKPSGILLISEVRSRFEESGIDVFIQAVCDIGFTMRRKDMKNQMFATIEFQRTKAPASKPAAPKASTKAPTPTSASGKKKGGAQQQQGGKGDRKSGGKAATQFTHPIKKGAPTTTDGPVLTACIYKKR